VSRLEQEPLTRAMDLSSPLVVSAARVARYLDRRIINEWIHMSKMLPTELMSVSTVMYKGNLFDGVVILLYIKV
jgi:hypothetical protein